MRNSNSKSQQSGRFAYDGLDRVIHERARLSVLTSLIAHPKGLVFGNLRAMCGLTDGNLSRHLQVLEEAQLIAIDKGYDRNRPQTVCRITARGRQRYLDYLEVLEQVVRDAAQAARGANARPAPLVSSLGLRRLKTTRTLFLPGDSPMQSTVEGKDNLHVAVIMDGNGRWATRRGLPRSAGHRAGVDAVRRVVEAAPDLGVTTLTVFAFSSDNWRRPQREVSALMSLLRYYLRTEPARLIESGTRLTVIGRRDRLPHGLREAIAAAERATSAATRLNLQIALDYSGRDAIANAAARWRKDRAPSRQAFARLLAAPHAKGGGDVDLLIRTGGEKRLSDFLLWESAYAELCFVETLWPDFGDEHLRAALADFRGRERRFGALPSPPALVAAE